MARKPRIHYPGAFYHVMLRGNHRENIFFENCDVEYFYSLLDEGTQRFHYRIYAFCLMTNHVHLIVQVSDIPLSKIMQNIGFRYTRWINKRQKSIGHLFQGRYKAILIEEDEYLLDLIRYIHLNPVHANLVKNPEDYPWSSYSVYLKTKILHWLNTDWIFNQFSPKDVLYQDLLNLKKIDLSLKKLFLTGNQKNCDVLGSDIFLKKIGKKDLLTPAITFSELVKIICRHYKIHEKNLYMTHRKHIYSKIRAVIGWFVQEFHICTLTTVAKYFNRDVSTIIRKMNALIRDLKTHEELHILKKQIEDYFKLPTTQA